MSTPLNPLAIAAMREITGRFVSSGQATLTHEAKARLGRNRHVIDTLVQQRMIRFIGDKHYPRFSALEAEGADLRNYARRCTATVLEALKRLYAAKGEKTFPFTDVLAAAKAVDHSVTPEMVNLGMLLAYDFGNFVGGCSLAGIDLLPDADVITSISVREGILDFESLETAWQEEVAWRESQTAREKLITPSQDIPRESEPVNSLQADDFSFVVDKKLREIVERDYAELQRIKVLFPTKSRMILAGGLVEAVLLDELLRDAQKARECKKAENKPLDEWSLATLIDVAHELGLITTGSQRFGHVVREYRNLVHPGKERRSDYFVGREEANIAEEVLAIVIRDLRKKSGGNVD